MHLIETVYLGVSYNAKKRESGIGGQVGWGV